MVVYTFENDNVTASGLLNMKAKKNGASPGLTFSNLRLPSGAKVPFWKALRTISKDDSSWLFYGGMNGETQNAFKEMPAGTLGRVSELIFKETRAADMVAILRTWRGLDLDTLKILGCAFTDELADALKAFLHWNRVKTLGVQDSGVTATVMRTLSPSLKFVEEIILIREPLGDLGMLCLAEGIAGSALQWLRLIETTGSVEVLAEEMERRHLPALTQLDVLGRKVSEEMKARMWEAGKKMPALEKICFDQTCFMLRV